MLRLFRSGNKRTKTIWWVLIVITVLTFVGGFVFLFGAGLDSSARARQQGALGTVDGEPITREALQLAIADQRQNYQRQYGSEPADRDAKVVESQAWRALVSQKMLAKQARDLGLRATNPEVVLTLRTQPPQILASNPTFQTNGKFDPQKYQAALADPRNNWSEFENLIREQLPVRKLQERMLASIKLSEPELRDLFRERYERAQGVLVTVPVDPAAKVPAPTPADLDRVYNTYKSRFYATERVDLEMLTVPKKHSDEDVRSARQLAQSITDRARRGEKFEDLARDYSEGPNAQQGGLLNRVFQPSEFGPELGEYMMQRKAGDVTDPFLQGGSFTILKVLELIPDPASPVPSMRVAQIVIKVKPNEGTMREQFESLAKLRERGARLKSLGKAAVEQGLTTQKTGPFDPAQTPPALYATPEAVDWATSAKVGAVSPVFESPDGFVIAQLSEHKLPGPISRDELGETLRQVAELDARVTLAEPKAKQVQQAVAGGATLEQAAAAAGLVATPFSMTRAQPDPRLVSTPEVAGTIFGSPPGRVIGPMRAVNAWYLARLDHVVAPNPALYDSVKGQLSNETLQRRQQTFFTGWMNSLRAKAKVTDLRYER